MRQFFEFLAILLLCSVTLLIFVNIVENSIERSNPSNMFASSCIDDPHDNGSERLLDHKNFKYTIVPKICDATLLVWIVTSYAGDPTPRSALRRAYTSSELRKLGIKRVFLLGTLNDVTQRKTGVIQAAIKNEADRFGDIVQGNFNEAYRNLTYKHLMGLRWATESCKNVLYIIKQDDDIIIDLYEILKKLQTLTIVNPPNEIFAGYVLRDMNPVREPANKWYVTKEEFQDDVYPDFLSGWLYIVSRDIVVKLVRNSRSCKKYFWIDDVFVTGILRHELNIKLIDIRDIYTTDYRYLNCCIRAGRDRRIKCEFAIGPNGGKTELQVEFQNYAEFCRSRCERSSNYSIGKRCVVGYQEAKVQIGSAKIDPIQFV